MKAIRQKQEPGPNPDPTENQDKEDQAQQENLAQQDDQVWILFSMMVSKARVKGIKNIVPVAVGEW
jgi:hypothetical protein